ncbi:unnamed protein product [Schistocephalus solidus]|uniref:Uncharacterized protein n=1 Tax=Schistocephalus solidus TaxID=70667 RepID=A0A3P7D8M3_SCHSO|nr:unnamed protein product [Schistocephalus solidus]
MHFPICRSVEKTVVRKEQVVSCSHRHMNLGLQMPDIEVSIDSVCDADYGLLMMVGAHKHGRKHETAKTDGQFEDALQSANASETVLSSLMHAITPLRNRRRMCVNR